MAPTLKEQVEALAHCHDELSDELDNQVEYLENRIDRLETMIENLEIHLRSV